MILPDYNNSIVNLSGSVLDAFGATSLYHPLPELHDLNQSQNVILLIIDGLGSEYLKKYGRESFLSQYLIKELTSVFPSTTASAVISLETGVAPQQHGITGWFMFLKEMGCLSAILPFRPRYGGNAFINDIKKDKIYTEKSVADKINTDAYVVYPKEIASRKEYRKDKKIKSYTTLQGMFSQIKRCINVSEERKYIYAYWGNFDEICHESGCASIKAKHHFQELDNKIASFVKSLKSRNTSLLVTADHGLIDTKESQTIYLQNHPTLYNTLTMPLCGEPRVAYCYVHPSKHQQFEEYVKNELRQYCIMYKSADLLNSNVFGLYEPHPMLIERIGDYILIMKENYIIKDWLITEERFFNTGNHGGVSKDEMIVPLIWVRSY